MRTVALLGTSAVATFAALALAACGSSAGGGAGTGVSPSAPAGGGAGGTALTITLLDNPSAAAQTWTLTCDPAGGTHPDPSAACAALAATEDPFKALDPAMACTQIYGGPQTATVTGTYKGAAVNASFSRTDGCEIARWDAIHAALGSTGGA